MPELTDTERAILDFEHECQWWARAGAKDAAIRDRFGLSATIYYATLRALLRRSEAVEYRPVVVSRLLRLEVARRKVRTA